MLNPGEWMRAHDFVGGRKSRNAGAKNKGYDRVSRSGWLRLLSQVELSDDRTVTLDVVLLQVAQKVSSVTNHLLQTSAAVEILGICLEVLGQVCDSGAQDRDLNLGRTGVALVDGIGLDNLLLFVFLHGHGSIHLSKIKYLSAGN